MVQTETASLPLVKPADSPYGEVETSLAGEKFPVQRGENLSVQRGEQIPVQRGENLSVQAGEKFPGQRGESLSVQRGEQFPAPAGGQFPVQRGENLSMQRGEQLPAETAGEQLPVPRGEQFPVRGDANLSAGKSSLRVNQPGMCKAAGWHGCCYTASHQAKQEARDVSGEHLGFRQDVCCDVHCSQR